MKHKQSPTGFSLIELLIAVGVILFMAGGGIASFINFNEKQQVINGAKELQEHLRMAQTLSRIGEVPDSCGKLAGYRVTSQDAAGGKEIKVLAACSAGDLERNSFLLPETVTLDADIDIVFLGLHGGVSGASEIQIIGGSGRTYTFEVTQGGEITQGEIL